jgi:hypothetical protein
MKKLTKAEEQIMQYLWELNEAFLKDIMDKNPEPKPAYTTMQTVVRVLTQKGVIGYKRLIKSMLLLNYLLHSFRSIHWVPFFTGTSNRFMNFKSTTVAVM